VGKEEGKGQRKGRKGERETLPERGKGKEENLERIPMRARTPSAG
jgi:hypothetical protein